jgi:hypothetical protein
MSAKYTIDEVKILEDRKRLWNQYQTDNGYRRPILQRQLKALSIAWNDLQKKKLPQQTLLPSWENTARREQ